MKSEPTGHLNLDETAAADLGLGDLSREQRILISAHVLTRPISAGEAALGMLGIETIQKSDPVSFVSSTPPDMRTMRVGRNEFQPDSIFMPPVDLYMNRLTFMETLTFSQYFKRYDIRKEGLIRKPHVRTFPMTTTCMYA